MRQTSLEAYEYIKANNSLSTKRFRVYEIIFKHGPLTGGECAKIYRQVYNDEAKFSESIRNRITELNRQGVVTEVNQRPCKVSGRNSIVWQVTKNLPKKLPKPLTAREKIRRLKEAYYLVYPYAPLTVKRKANEVLHGN